MGHGGRACQPANGHQHTGLEGEPRTCEEARQGEAEQWAAGAKGLGEGGGGINQVSPGPHTHLPDLQLICRALGTIGNAEDQ